MTRRTSTSPAARTPLLALSLLALATPAGAQGKYSIGVHVSRNEALPSSPTLGGLSFGSFSGPLGLRLNGAMNLVNRRPPNLFSEQGRAGIGAWTADADVVLAPLRGAGLFGFAPYGFLGIGMQGVRLADGSDPSLGMWSYGGGVSMPLFLGLSIDGDVRRRVPLSTREPLPAGFSKAWEYRAGLSFSFGGGHRRRSEMADRRRETRSSRSPRPMVTASRVPRRAERASTLSASRLIVTADRYVGTDYRYGGQSPSEGFDCSGFVQYVYARHDLQLPRTARQMAATGRAVAPDLDRLRPGDLVLFAQNGTRIDHVAIYVGDDRIIHATSSGGGVRYDDLHSARGRWFFDRMVGARRLISDGRSLVDEMELRDALDATVTHDSLDPPDRAPRPR